MTKKIQDLKAELKEKYAIDVDKLIVAFLGGFDMVIGEFVPGCPEGFALKNPKRLARFVHQSSQGIQVSMVINDLDLMGETGGISFNHPIANYSVDTQSDETKLNVYSLYKAYFEQKALQKAAAAGIVMPQSGIQRG